MPGKGNTLMKGKILDSLIVLVYAFLLCLCAALLYSDASADTMYCSLNQKIATRTGPSTSYDEPGTFFRTD